jgi:hypothetical protein
LAPPAAANVLVVEIRAAAASGIYTYSPDGTPLSGVSPTVAGSGSLGWHGPSGRFTETGLDVTMNSRLSHS